MEQNKSMIHVGQGEQAVSGDPAVIFSTILGSCVSTCLYDPGARLGGLNHIIVPEEQSKDPFGLMSQVNAMERLINTLLQNGALRSRLVAKVFGGAALIGSCTAIGEKNAAFVMGFLTDEGIPVASKSLGGTLARRVRFDPTEGRAQLKFVSERPVEFRTPTADPASQQGVELF